MLAHSSLWNPGASFGAVFLHVQHNASIPAKRAVTGSAGLPSDTPIRTTCAECGVIESLREIQSRAEQAAGSTRNDEFIIRFRDGSTRVFNEATPRIWRLGAEVKVIH
jgi:hypothetical protein